MLLEVLLQCALIVKAFDVSAAANKFAIDEDTRHCACSRQFTQHRLYILSIGTLIQFDNHHVHLHLAELLLGHAAVGAIGFAEYDHLVIADHIPHELCVLTVHFDKHTRLLHRTYNSAHLRGVQQH